MKVVVFGTGGVGGYFGARLAEAGNEVTFIARGAHLDAIRADGLRVFSTEGDVHIDPARATDDPAAVGVADVVLVAVKAWQVADAAEAMKPLVGEATTVLPLQNGVDAPDALRAVLGPAPVVGGLCGLISYIEAPGVIRHAGSPPFVVLGELDRKRSERCERIRAAFEQAGVNAIVPDDIHVAMWRKFLFISSFSGVGAVTRATAGEFRDIPETRALIEQAFAEVAAVAHARGVVLPDDAVAEALASLDALPPEGTASMQRDIMSGRPSELVQQNGAVVRMGKEAGVSTPAHSFLYASLLPAEMQTREQRPQR